jgi:hypothetical protein
MNVAKKAFSWERPEKIPWADSEWGNQDFASGRRFRTARPNFRDSV